MLCIYMRLHVYTTFYMCSYLCRHVCVKTLQMCRKIFYEWESCAEISHRHKFVTIYTRKYMCIHIQVFSAFQVFAALPFNFESRYLSFRFMDIHLFFFTLIHVANPRLWLRDYQSVYRSFQAVQESIGGVGVSYFWINVLLRGPGTWEGSKITIWR